jgi:hypothetical protein
LDLWNYKNTKQVVQGLEGDMIRSKKNKNSSNQIIEGLTQIHEPLGKMDLNDVRIKS